MIYLSWQQIKKLENFFNNFFYNNPISSVEQFFDNLFKYIFLVLAM